MYCVSPQNPIIFTGAIATVMSQVSIVTCYGNRAKTCTAPRIRPFSTIPVSLPLNNIFQQGFIQYKAIAVPLICPRKVTQSVIKLYYHSIICTRQEELGNETRFPKLNTTVHCSIRSKLNIAHNHINIPLTQSMVSLNGGY